MKSYRLRRLLDPGLLLALALTLFAAIPLTSNPGLPNGSDTLLHSHRLAEMQRNWSEGFFLGNGSPILRFNGSLTYYLTSILHLLFKLGASEALRLLLLLSLLMCSGGMYLFCKRRSGRLGALIAGLVYVYSPYLMYTEAYARGAYPELLAFALFPLLLWRIDALRDKPNAINFLLVCLLQVALINAHNLMALTLTAIAFAWVIFETLIQQFNGEASQMNARAGALAALAMLLGILATATFWQPILLESDSVQLEYLEELGFRGNFVGLGALLSPPPISDAGAINGLRELRILGVAQWSLAVAGAVSALLLYIRGYRSRHPQAFLGTVFFALSALALVALMLPAAEGIWSGLRPLQFLQFPWRLLGPTAACLAIVASMNGLWLNRLVSRYQISTSALVIALPIVAVIPLLYVPEWRHDSLDAAIAGYQAAESAPLQLGSTPARDIAALVSMLAIALACIAAWLLRKTQHTPRPYWTAAPLSRTETMGVLLGGAIAILCLIISFREGVAWLNSPPGEALPAQFRRTYTLDGSLQLLGYDLDADVYQPGETLVFSAYWYAIEETGINFSSFLHVSTGGLPVARADKLHPADRAISEWWGPEGYIYDSYELQLPPDLPAGEYQLIIGLYTCELMPADDCGNGYRPTVTDANGEVIGDSIALTTIRVETL